MMSGWARTSSSAASDGDGVEVHDADRLAAGLVGLAADVHLREAVASFLNQATIMMTGAGGSIGSEPARKIADF